MSDEARYHDPDYLAQLVDSADNALGRKLLDDEVETFVSQLHTGGIDSAADWLGGRAQSHNFDDANFRQEYMARRTQGEGSWEGDDE